MKLLLRLLLLAAIALPLGAAVALWMCFQDAPLIARKAEISVNDIERAKRILAKHDPRKAKAGTLRTMILSQHDVDLVLNYAASQWRRGSTRVVLLPGAATVQASLELPGSPFGPWLNVDAHLNTTAEGRLAYDVVKSVKLSAARVQIVYE